MERSEALGLPPELKSHRGPCFLVPHFLLPLLGFSELTSESSSELSMVLSNSLDSSSSPSILASSSWLLQTVSTPIFVIRIPSAICVICSINLVNSSRHPFETCRSSVLIISEMCST